MEKKRVVSLFAGCGGLDSGFLNNDAYTHVLVNEINVDACKTYEANFGIKPICCDVAKLKDIPDCDLIIGGFPCQGFSTANLNRKETDNRNFLYLEILRILGLKKPSYFLLENVKGLLSMGGYESKEDKKAKIGKVMKTILADLRACGYNVTFKVFDIKLYDVPQTRQRVIIVGVRTDIAFIPKWPEPVNTTQIQTLKDAIGDLPIEYDEEIQHIGTKHKCIVKGFPGNTLLKWDAPSPTITASSIHNHPSLQRRLTVRENARIQTFSDTFKFSGSMTSMYKQIANAVPCKFSEHLSKIFQDAPVS
jgi:DNA (cytosine-5)-methyltransferase 1